MNPMKPRTFMALCLLLTLALPFSDAIAMEQTAASDEESLQSMLRAYQRVLAGTESYFQYDPDANVLCDPDDTMDTEAYMTDEITVWYRYMFGRPLRREAFAITDLDADGYPELLLKLSDDFGYELLRVYDGRVYGYPFVARGMEAVTVDGDIHASSGAENFGWYRLAFREAQLEPALLCWKDDTAEPGERFIIDNAIVDEAEFIQMNETLWSKETIRLTDYSQEAFSEAVEGY